MGEYSKLWVSLIYHIIWFTFLMTCNGIQGFAMDYLIYILAILFCNWNSTELIVYLVISEDFFIRWYIKVIIRAHQKFDLYYKTTHTNILKYCTGQREFSFWHLLFFLAGWKSPLSAQHNIPFFRIFLCMSFDLQREQNNSLIPP